LLPVQLPFVAVSVWPSVGVPVSVGGFVFFGGATVVVVVPVVVVVEAAPAAPAELLPRVAAMAVSNPSTAMAAATALRRGVPCGMGSFRE
jgi:hypothetical protein